MINNNLTNEQHHFHSFLIRNKKCYQLKKEKRLLIAVSLIIVLTPLGFRGMINRLNL